MPSAERQLTLRDALQHVSGTCAPTSSEDLVGIEAEWLTSRGGAQPDLEDLAGASALPTASAVTLEPGGQIEISSPAGSLQQVLDVMRREAAEVRGWLASHDVQTIGRGMDQRRGVRRLLQAPRYEAMEAFFDHRGPHGRRMMRQTAAIQINLSAGADPDARWQIASSLAPVLAAMFANSPAPGLLCSRLDNWFRMDRSRTSPVPISPDVRTAWASFALEARVMMVRVNEQRFIPGPPEMTFSNWIESGGWFGYPTLDDLEYHLTTLFPPVRARGWFELRMIDAQADPFWLVPLAIAASVLRSSEAHRLADHTLMSTWPDVPRQGLREPRLASAAKELGKLALEETRGLDQMTRDECGEFLERYTFRGRCPAEDLVEQGSSAA